MKKNMGKTDIRMRVMAAFLIVLLYFFGLISGTFAIILLVIAVVFLITSTLGYCPLYDLFGVSTNKSPKSHS